MPSGVKVQVLSSVPDELMQKPSLLGWFFIARYSLFRCLWVYMETEVYVGVLVYILQNIIS